MAGGGGAATKGAAGVIGEAGGVDKTTIEADRTVEMTVKRIVRMAAGTGDGRSDAKIRRGVHVCAVTPRRHLAGIGVGAAMTEVTTGNVGSSPGCRVG